MKSHLLKFDFILQVSQFVSFAKVWIVYNWSLLHIKGTPLLHIKFAIINHIDSSIKSIIADAPQTDCERFGNWRSFVRDPDECYAKAIKALNDATAKIAPLQAAKEEFSA